MQELRKKIWEGEGRSGGGERGGKNGAPHMCPWMPHLESETQEKPGEPAVAGRGEVRLVMLGKLMGFL